MNRISRRSATTQALIAGERDPETLAQLAKARLRNKHGALTEALTGRFDEHHAFLCRIILRRIDELSTVIEEVTTRIDAELAPFQNAIDHLVTIPGVDRPAAAVIIAETGADMSRFPTAGHLSSWAGVCPGSHESVGIRKSGTTREGNKALGGALGLAAMSAGAGPTSQNQPTVRSAAPLFAAKRGRSAVTGYFEGCGRWQVSRGFTPT